MIKNILIVLESLYFKLIIVLMHIISNSVRKIYLQRQRNFTNNVKIFRILVYLFKAIKIKFSFK